MRLILGRRDETHLISLYLLLRVPPLPYLAGGTQSTKAKWMKSSPLELHQLLFSAEDFFPQLDPFRHKKGSELPINIYQMLHVVSCRWVIKHENLHTRRQRPVEGGTASIGEDVRMLLLVLSEKNCCLCRVINLSCCLLFVTLSKSSMALHAMSCWGIGWGPKCPVMSLWVKWYNVGYCCYC